MNILNKIREDVYGTPLWIDEVNDTGDSVSTFPSFQDMSAESDHIVLGFDDFKQCQDFANKYNLEIIKAYRPKRHRFFKNLGVTNKPFSIVDYIRNNNNAAICGVVNEEFINYLRENSSLSDDNYKELKRMLKDSTEGYSPIWTEKSFIFTGHFDETYFKNEQMEFENGKAEFVIGVLVPNEGNKPLNIDYTIKKGYIVILPLNFHNFIGDSPEAILGILDDNGSYPDGNLYIISEEEYELAKEQLQRQNVICKEIEYYDINVDFGNIDYDEYEEYEDNVRNAFPDAGGFVANTSQGIFRISKERRRKWDEFLDFKPCGKR